MIINVAMSLNGKISSSSGRFSISDRNDWDRTINLRRNVDAVLIGAGTVISDDPELKCSKTRIILDGNLRLNDNYRVFDGKIKTYIITGKEGYIKNSITLKLNDLSIKNILRELYKKNIKSILVEGGADVIKQFFLNKLFDEFYIYINPGIILSGIPLFQGFEVAINYNILRLDNGILLSLKREF